MDVNIKNTFSISSKKLFVIVVEHDYDSLLDFQQVMDNHLKLSFPIHSIELVRLSGVTYPGITLEYGDDEELRKLLTIFRDSSHLVLVSR